MTAKSLGDPKEPAPLLATHGRGAFTRRALSPGVGAELRAARRRAGWSSLVAAERVGISGTYLRALERGERCPSTITARALIDALRLPPDLAADLMAEAVPDAGQSRTVWAS